MTAKLANSIDLSLFIYQEDEEEVQFTIRESTVVEQLHDFLQEQFSLYPANDRELISTTLARIANMKSFQEMIELAEEKSSPYFQDSSVYDYIEVGPWKRIRAELSLFVFLLEGKIIMEGYNNFLKYIENLVRAKSQHAIGGALRVIIQ